MSGPTITRLETTDAFVVVDLPHAERADGIVRCARKVLVDSTKALARSRTYSWALLGQQVSGASGAINAVDDDRVSAIEAFCAETGPEVAAGRLTLEAGKGITHDDLAPLGDIREFDRNAFVEGVLASAAAAKDRHSGGSSGLDSATVAIEFDAGAGEELAAALESRGAEVVARGADALRVECDILLFGSKAGIVDHDVAAELSQKVLVPTGSLAFTPRALAVAQRREITVLPDFLTTAGALAARADLDPVTFCHDKTEEVLAHGSGPVLGACLIAEDFLSTWCEELPFGRPIG